MPELADYSGKFIPDLRIEDFSKDILTRWSAEYGRQHLLQSGLWFNYFRTKMGVQIADESHWQIWEELQEVHEEDRPKVALDMWGHDVEACLKWFQMDMDFMDWDIDCEMKSPEHGIITVRNCSALRHFEKHQDIALLENACGLDVWGFPKALTRICPDAHTVCIECPPRKSKDRPSCVWDVKLDPEHKLSWVCKDLPEYAQRAQRKAAAEFHRRLRYPYRYLISKRNPRKK